MLFQKEISEAFERNALEYFGKDFDKHKNYLLNVAFGRNSALMPQQEFDNAISIYKTNPRKCVKDLFEALSPAIEKTMETIHTRGLSLKTKHDNGSLSVDDNGGEKRGGKSERSSGPRYKAKLTSPGSSCPYFQKR